MENFIQAMREAAPVDRILIAGDIEGEKEEYDRLVGLTPLVVVQGNCDAYLGSSLPLTAVFTVEGKRFFMTHGHYYSVGYGKPFLLLEDAKAKQADFVVFGHTHHALDETWDGIRFLNPGALRGNPASGYCSYAILELDGRTGRADVSFRKLSDPGSPEEPDYAEDILDTELVRKVMREISKGRSADQISRRLGIHPVTAEKLCRIILTHPGADADAVLHKYEIMV